MPRCRRPARRAQARPARVGRQRRAPAAARSGGPGTVGRPGSSRLAGARPLPRATLACDVLVHRRVSASRIRGAPRTSRPGVTPPAARPGREDRPALRPAARQAPTARGHPSRQPVDRPPRCGHPARLRARRADCAARAPRGGRTRRRRTVPFPGTGGGGARRA